MSPRQQRLTESIGAGLWHLCWPLLAGLALGGLLVLILRRRRLRFSWCLFGLPITYCAWFGPYRTGAVIVGVATATALWLGRRLHTEDLTMGGEEARAAQEAIGPLAWLRLRIAERRTARRKRAGDSLPLGRTPHGRVARVPLGAPRHGVHCLIAGATGSGKTVTMAAIAVAHILRGAGLIVIDPKGDDALRATIEQAAAAAGVAFHAWSPHGPGIYNPLRFGGPTEIADKCLAAHEWSEPHYRVATQRLLGHALATLRARGEWPPTLSRLVEAMHPDRLDALAAEAGGTAADRVHAYLDGLDQTARAALVGGRDRLAVLVESELGPFLDPSLGEGTEIDLTAALDRGEVIYLRQDADRYPEASKLLSAALLTDLAALSAERQGSGCSALVAIDEFGAVGAGQIVRLAARCRGAGMSLMLGTQSLADLRAVDPGADTLTEQVISNVSYIVAHRIAHADAAELLARVAGTVPAWSITQRVDGHGLALPSGEGTRTRQRDFRINPDRFKSLQTGEAVLIRPTDRRPAEVINVWPAPLAATAPIEKGALR